MSDTITNIKPVNESTLEYQEYSNSDNNLISSFDLTDIPFNNTLDFIEYHIFDFNKNLVLSDYNFKDYSIIDNKINIDIENNLKNKGFDEGQYYALYNFLSPLFNSSPTNNYFISEISSDRTEIRISSTVLDSLSIFNGYNQFISSSSDLSYYPDFYINLGDNNLLIANNVLLDDSIPDEFTILIKLYEPLPINFDLNSQLWVVNKLSNSIAYSIELIFILTDDSNFISLKGPNLNIPLKDQINNSTEYSNYTSLNLTTSSFLSNQLNSFLQNNSVELNIDYSDYSNFIHFSSANTRLENFYYKLLLLDTYQSQSNSISSSINSYISSSQLMWDDKIKEVIKNFDEYEYYLYYNSESKAWPKSNSIPPYINFSPNSSEGQTWLVSQLETASLYDNENKDALVNTIPSYLREDPTNEPYKLFVQMLGQHFDNIYLYYQEVSNKYNNDNRVNAGISKDLISDALKDFGLKIYQNNFSTDDLYSSFLGITPEGGLLPTTGSELITTYITASATGSIIPLNDVNNEIYKRLYHNIPYLLKKKGTLDGLKTLINIYGIPDTVLRINEYGGKDKNNSNDWDYFQNEFNYSFFTTESGYVKYDVPISESGGYGNTFYGQGYYGGRLFPTGSFSVEFRFKTTGIPTISGFSQSLAHFSPDLNFNLVLEYTESKISGSYDGSIVNPYINYGTLKFIDNNLNSASVYLPLFNNDWWSVLVTTSENYPHTNSLYVKNKIYTGNDGSQIGFEASSSITGSAFYLLSSQSFYLSYPNNITLAGKTYTPFSGSFQELRFYKTAISESVFDDYVMNPYSIEGNQLTGPQSSLNSLIFRAPLGSTLDNTILPFKTSIHPSITNYPPTQSFKLSGSSIYNLSGSYSFTPNREIIYLDQFPAGIKNAISDKIKITDAILPEGDVLSPFISIQQKFPISESYTRDTNYVEVAFSPQNEINDDIISQLGYFNIGDYIGDPRQLVNKNINSYPDFNKLRDEYFKKYQEKYNLKDYIRLIKYFDNSLFKLIKDFIPARTNLASGIVIKQHLLERNRYSPAQTEYEFHNEFTASVKSFPYDYNENVTLYKTEGGTGGIIPDSYLLNNTLNYPGAVDITQSWVEEYNSPQGILYITHNSEDEFYNGELKGSKLILINPTNSTENSTPLYGNADVVPSNPRYISLDQITYNLTQAELDLILSGSGTLSTVKQYNYELKRSIHPRYIGSRLTSDGINNSSIFQSSFIQSSSKIYLNPVKDKTIPVNNWDTTIFEFKGGKSSIEIPNVSRVDINSFLNVDSTSSVSLINPSDLAFSSVLEQKFPIGSNPYIDQYTSDLTLLPSLTTVVSNTITPIPIYMITQYPQDWSYISGSQTSNTPQFIVTGSFYKITEYVEGDNFDRIGSAVEGTMNTKNCIFFCPPWFPQPFVNTAVTWSNGSNLSRIKGDSYVFLAQNNPNQINIYERANLVYQDNSGNYTPRGSTDTLSISQSIDNGIKQGERWFISLYSTPFIAPINIDNVNPYPNTFPEDLSSDNNILAYNSAYEIKSVDTVFTPSQNIIVFRFKSPADGSSPKITNISPIFGGNSNEGLIIWKSPANPNTLLFNKTFLNNLGPGNMTTTNVRPDIKSNLDYIVKTFGNKT